MNQGATEFLLAMGLQDHIAGQRAVTSAVDPIWPRYAEAYAQLPVITSSGYPTEEQMMEVDADFIFASWRSAYREYEPPRVATEDTSGAKGIYSNKTVGPCNGVNSDFFPAGANTTTTYSTYTALYSTCRPQLHAAGVGTWLEPVSCEDETLRMPGTEETVYAAINTIGEIFNVPDVANQLISEMKNDFNIAEQALAASSASGHSLTAVWLDCVSCCQNEPEPSVRCQFDRAKTLEPSVCPTHTRASEGPTQANNHTLPTLPRAHTGLRRFGGRRAEHHHAGVWLHQPVRRPREQLGVRHPDRHHCRQPRRDDHRGSRFRSCA